MSEITLNVPTWFLTMLTVMTFLLVPLMIWKDHLNLKIQKLKKERRELEANDG